MLYREDLRECRKKKKELLLVNVVKKARRGTASSRDQVQSISKARPGGALSVPQVSAAVSAYIDGDLAGSCLIGFRHLYFEYAIAIIGANRIRLHGLR